ncbi:MAG: diadenylate cyclase CdaA [Firmicutes bacterium]|nr:diadenylate cyclase CdaA [Bacillota bacterium]
MGFFEQIWNWIRTNSGITFIPKLGLIDLIDILFIAYLFYKILVWFRKTRAWTLLKGVVFLLIVALVANMLQMNLTSWLLQNTMFYGVLAVVIIFQPEIRRALERLGHSGLFSIFNSGDMEERVSRQTVSEIASAMEIMSAAKTGALIAVEQDVRLGEYEQTGIRVDAVVSEQLLINIFEKNTPLHDGAVIISNNRVTYATCYLPLSDNLTISKELGTRHRAALGLSEVSDAKIFVVSEETGTMSMAEGGVIHRGIDHAFIMNQFQHEEKSEGVAGLMRRVKELRASKEAEKK